MKSDDWRQNQEFLQSNENYSEKVCNSHSAHEATLDQGSTVGRIQAGQERDSGEKVSVLQLRF